VIRGRVPFDKHRHVSVNAIFPRGAATSSSGVRGDAPETGARAGRRWAGRRGRLAGRRGGPEARCGRRGGCLASRGGREGARRTGACPVRGRGADPVDLAERGGGDRQGPAGTGGARGRRAVPGARDARPVQQGRVPCKRGASGGKRSGRRTNGRRRARARGAPSAVVDGVEAGEGDQVRSRIGVCPVRRAVRGRAPPPRGSGRER
jgi:hypothetical protein